MMTHSSWDSYCNGVIAALGTVWEMAFESAVSELVRASEAGRTIYVAGNGGSAAIANHLACDFGKGAGMRVVSLSANSSVLTAYANDHGYDSTISSQVASLVKPGDVVILISSSGNSPNILKAVKAAKEREAVVIGLTGFDGGQLSRTCDLTLHVDSDNYGCVEDTHSMMMHALAQCVIASKSHPSSGAV